MIIDGLILLVAILAAGLLVGLALKNEGPPRYRCRCGVEFPTFTEMDEHQREVWS